MTGRITPGAGDHLPSLRRRRPAAYWMTLVLAVLMLLSLLLPIVAVLFA